MVTRRQPSQRNRLNVAVLVAPAPPLVFCSPPCRRSGGGWLYVLVPLYDRGESLSGLRTGLILPVDFGSLPDRPQRHQGA
jgi:hypothetical protein